MGTESFPPLRMREHPPKKFWGLGTFSKGPKVLPLKISLEIKNAGVTLSLIHI